MGVVAFLTDFGLEDGFAGVMKGVVLSINPEAKIVDLTHGVKPFDILGGAMILKAHYRYFPKKTVFVAVVDPGVGTERKPVAVQTENFLFVAPMNGLLDLVLKEEKPLKVVELSNPRYRLKAVNNTFHGRDIFSPAAAYLSKGLPITELGKPIEYRYLLEFPEPQIHPDRVEGEIIYFDRFGNAVTNIPCGEFRECFYKNLKGPYVKAFLYGKRKSPNFTCGSFGFVEAFIPEGNFQETYSAQKGEKVVCYR